MTAVTAPADRFAATFERELTLGNWVRDRNPITTLLVLASLAVVAFGIPGAIAPVAVSVVFLGIAFAGGVGRSFTMTFLKLWLVVGLLLFVLRAALLKGATVLFSLGPIAVTKEGIIEGLRFSTVVMAICGAVALFFALVPIRNLMLALELRGLTPYASYVLLASFQAITDLGKTAKVVLDAQKARGIETEGSIGRRIRAFVPVLAPVFLSAMTATEERAIALDARAFNSRIPHSHLVIMRATPRWEWVVVVLAIAAAILSCIGGAVEWF